MVPKQIVRRLATLMPDPVRPRELIRVARSERPGIRAALGVLLDSVVAGGTVKPAERCKVQADLDELQDTLNPLSSLDAGVLAKLPGAAAWQAMRGAIPSR